MLLLLLVRSWRNDQDDDDDGVCTLREKGRRRFLGVARFLVVPRIEEEPPSIQSRVTTTLKKKVTQEFGGQKQE